MEDMKEKKSKIKLIIKSINFLILSFFPGLKILALNKGLKRARKFVKNKWFMRQIWRNRVVAFSLTLPLFLSFGASFKIMDNDQHLKRGLSRVDYLISSKDYTKSYEQLKSTFFYHDTTKRIAASSKILFYGFLISFFFGWTFITLHPLITNSRRFAKILKQNGVIDDLKNAAVLATPVGYLFKITGNSSAKGIKENDVIWRAMNVRIGTFSEDPDDRSFVFFYKNYELERVYNYEMKAL